VAGRSSMACRGGDAKVACGVAALRDKQALLPRSRRVARPADSELLVLLHRPHAMRRDRERSPPAAMARQTGRDHLLRCVERHDGCSRAIAVSVKSEGCV
jgi:hypothetical protein